MSERDGKATRVTIFGEEYTLRSEMDEEYTRACARHVDQAMQDAHVKSHVSDPHRAAILAAMEITDEFFQVRAERDRLREQLGHRMAELRDRVEEALSG